MKKFAMEFAAFAFFAFAPLVTMWIIKGGI